MKLERAAELMGPNLVLPEAFSAGLAAEFSQDELEKLKDVPLQESDLQTIDIYKHKNELSLGGMVKENFILFPMPAKARAFELMRHFGFSYSEARKLFFINNSERGEARPPVAGWKEWFFDENACADHPIYRGAEAGWRLLRKEPIAATMGETLEAGQKRLARADAVPTLLEILVAIVAYYFSIIDPRKKDEAVGMPYFSTRDLHGRLLHGKMAWTSDIFESKNNPRGENLTVGYNLPSIGIDIYKLNAAQASGVVGVLPIRRLGFN